MAKDTLALQFRLEAGFETLQTIRRLLADETIQAEIISLTSETIKSYLARRSKCAFQMSATLKAPLPRKIRRGPHSPLPKVRNGILSWYDEDANITNTVGPVGSADYVAWLENDWARSFRYESAPGSFTAIKENRGGRPVWYAHRRRAGQLHRVYLGKTENLTAAKLAETVRKLNAREGM